jgi:anti-sigma-K factor RskA
VNIKEYIASGIVESYVLGLLTAQERFEFEKYCEAYPELKAARESFELAIEKQAMENAVQPPPEVKEKTWFAIKQTTTTSKIISMESMRTNRRSSFSWVAAAAVILFLVAGYFAYNFYTQAEGLKTDKRQLEARLNTADSVLEQQKIMNDPNVRVINMTALTPNAPVANIYWDTTSANVYLVIKNMPSLASDKQYQLWSLIESNGLKPTSLGLFDGGKEKIILKMNGVQKADAFAITIENKGNTGGPDLKQLQNMGKTTLK